MNKAELLLQLVQTLMDIMDGEQNPDDNVDPNAPPPGDQPPGAPPVKKEATATPPRKAGPSPVQTRFTKSPDQGGKPIGNDIVSKTGGPIAGMSGG